MDGSALVVIFFERCDNGERAVAQEFFQGESFDHLTAPGVYELVLNFFCPGGGKIIADHVSAVGFLDVDDAFANTAGGAARVAGEIEYLSLEAVGVNAA